MEGVKEGVEGVVRGGGCSEGWRGGGWSEVVEGRMV